MLKKTIKAGVCLAVFSLPLYLIRFKISWIPFNLSEIIIYLVFLLWLADKLNGFWKSSFRIQKSDFQNHSPALSMALPVFLIFAGTTLSTLFSSNIEVGAGIWKGWFLTPLFLFFILLDNLNNRGFFKWLVFSAVFSGAAVSLISLFGWWGDNLTYDGRLRGFYSSANYLAMYLSPILILSLSLFLFIKKRIYKLLLVAVVGLTATVIYLTYSYGAFLGLLAASVFLVFGGVKDKRNFNWALFLFLFVVLFFVFQIQTDKFQEFLDLSYPSLKSRLAIWQSAGQILKDHPLIGIGPGMFQKYYLDYQSRFEPYPEWSAPQPHNIFLAFWLQTGLIGLIGFIWLMADFFKKSCRRLSSNKKEIRFLGLILGSAMLCILVHGLIDATYWKNDLAAVFWLVTAINYRADRLFG